MKLALDPFDRIVLVIIVGLLLAIGGGVAMGDRIGPAIVKKSPQQDENPSVTTNIQIEFGQPMKTNTVEQHFSIQPKIDGRSSWNGNRFTFQPSQPLSSRQQYTITLADGVESATGRRTTQSQVWSFKPREPSIIYLAFEPTVTRKVNVATMDGKSTRALFSAEQGIIDLVPSPDGTRIVLTTFSRGAATDLVVIDASTGNVLDTISCAPAVCEDPAWSADSQFIAYTRYELTLSGVMGQGRIGVYDLTRRQSASLYQDNQVLGTKPIWSADGSKIAFYNEAEHSIRVLNVRTQQAISVPTLMFDSGSFSPDGRSLVYANYQSFSASPTSVQLWLASLEGATEFKPLSPGTPELMMANNPTWSPDGKWIAFLRRFDDKPPPVTQRVMLYNTTTAQVRSVSAAIDYNAVGLHWSPSSDRLMVQLFDTAKPTSASEIWVYDISTDQMTRALTNAIRAQWIP